MENHISFSVKELGMRLGGLDLEKKRCGLLIALTGAA